MGGVTTEPCHDCPTYVCTGSGELECPLHGGFDICCDRPDCPGRGRGGRTFRITLCANCGHPVAPTANMAWAHWPGDAERGWQGIRCPSTLDVATPGRTMEVAEVQVVQMPVEKAKALTEARLALRAIRLEVPAAVADDITRRVEAAFEALAEDGL